MSVTPLDAPRPLPGPPCPVYDGHPVADPVPRAAARLTGIVCQGVDPATGQRCGRTYPRRGPAGGRGTSVSTMAAVVAGARAARWRVGRLPDGALDAMCPTCGEPDPAVVALCRDLGRSVAR